MTAVGKFGLASDDRHRSFTTWRSVLYHYPALREQPTERSFKSISITRNTYLNQFAVKEQGRNQFLILSM